MSRGRGERASYLPSKARQGDRRLQEDFGEIFFGAGLERKGGKNWHEHVFLAHNQIGGVQRGELEAVAVGDGVGGAGLDTVAAEDAAVVVDVVDLGVALGRGDALLFGVFGGLDVDAVGGAGGGAEEAGDTLFQAVLVALQLVLAAEALLELGAAHGARAVGVVLDLGGLEGISPKVMLMPLAMAAVLLTIDIASSIDVPDASTRGSLWLRLGVYELTKVDAGGVAAGPKFNLARLEGEALLGLAPVAEHDVPSR